MIAHTILYTVFPGVGSSPACLQWMSNQINRMILALGVVGLLQRRGVGVAQSVERATPGEEVLGPILTMAARSLLVGSVSV